MGFFSRRRAATVPASPPTQTTAIASPQAFTSPPPYQCAPSYTSPFELPQGQQQAQWQDFARDDDFMSVQDFNAVQRALNQDEVTDQFSNIIENIDEDRWNENEDDFSIMVLEEQDATGNQLGQNTRALLPHQTAQNRGRPAQPRAQKVTIWSKVSFYSNSRLPPNLPTLRVYIPTWPLICLAAQYSASAYKSPASSRERSAFVSANARLGTKAMVMKSVPCDEKKTLVFAIRGTSTLSLRDWNVNLLTAPISPAGFLDDEGNLCHEGFLRVAKAMVKPIAERLASLLRENPSRAGCDLLITGHSAGGAVAALLFAHMLSSVKSELSELTNFFKRVHCVTFGAPPVTLLPLTKPAEKRFQKSLFFSFINEGDPVVRAEKAYIRSLACLLSSSPPPPSSLSLQKPAVKASPLAKLQGSVSRLDLTLSKLDLTNVCGQTSDASKTYRTKHTRKNCSQPSISFATLPQLAQRSELQGRLWPVPQATLSNAGRLVVMRVPFQPAPQKRRGSELQRATSYRWERDNLSKVTAHTVTDEQLRRVIFGDPAMHGMETYLRRVDMLALKAVTARG